MTTRPRWRQASRFNHKPSDLYLETVAKLRELEKAEHCADAAYGEARSDELLASWAEVKGLRRGGRPCLHRLLGRRCPQNYPPYEMIDDHGLPRTPLGGDHASFWLKDGKPWGYVSQPYGIDGEEVQQLLTLGKQHGFTVWIDARWAWHYPGQALLIVLRPA